MIREFTNISLRERNSFHAEQSAARLIEYQTAQELQEIFEHKIQGAWYLLSGGNNILFTRNFEGTLLTPVAQQITLLSAEADRVRVRVEAGREWDELVEWAVERELWGLENLSLIPGKVGAAPVQNIGAYGCEAKDTIVEVEVFRTDLREVVTMPASACDFAYRESIFKGELKGRAIILSVTLELSKTPHPKLDYGDVVGQVEARGGATLRNIRESICAIRRSKLPDPAVTGNAGSFFKNPIVDRTVAETLRARFPEMPLYPVPESESKAKLAAGWLIDQAGMKGYAEAHVGIHPRQALVLINLGGATGGQVIALARKVQARVKACFGVEIDTEVNIL